MKVLLADDQHEVRKALRLLLEQEPGLNVVGEVSDAIDLFDQVETIDIDLVLLDWELPGLRDIDGSDNSTYQPLAILRSLRPNLVVVALSGRPEAKQTAIPAGADAFVSKCDPPDRLLRMLRKLNGNRQNGSNHDNLEKK